MRPDGREQDGGRPGRDSGNRERNGGGTRKQDRGTAVSRNRGATRELGSGETRGPRQHVRENRDEVRYGTPGVRDKAKAAGNRDK